MPALAPVVTQTVATDLTPCPAGTKLADLTPGVGETDPGPFVYALGTNASSFAITGTELFSALDLSGTTDVGVTVTGSDAIASPETVAPITVGTATGGSSENPYDDRPQGGYSGNPNVTPLLAPDAPDDADWDRYLVQAVNNIVPRARNTIDFVVAKPSWGEPNTITAWDDTALGACPTAEIETEARRLATEDQGVP